MERGEGRRRAPRPRSRKPAGVRWVAGSRGEAGSSPGRCERCGVDPKKCGVCPTTERGAVGGGSTPGYPDSLQEEHREAEGRQKWELATSGLETALGEHLGSLSPTGPRWALSAGAVPEGIAASQPGLRRTRGGSW